MKSSSNDPHRRTALWLVRPLCSLAMLALTMLAGAQDHPAMGGATGHAATEQLDFQTDLFTGGFSYDYPIRVPTGRNDSQPTISLGYRSSARNGWCGVGWTLDVGYIERDTRRGVPVRWNGADPLPEYDDDKGFVFSFRGAKARLVNVGGNEYRSATETLLLKFVYIKEPIPYWEVIDQNGTVFHFGKTTDSRLENPNTAREWNPGVASSVFKWSLNWIRDASGNETFFDYLTDTGVQYVNTISYNKNGDLPATHSVHFILEDARTDRPLSCATGFRAQLRKRLAAIEVRVQETLVRRYALTYINSSATRRSLLTAITEFAGDPSALPPNLPPKTFQYAQPQLGFGDDVDLPGVLNTQGQSAKEWKFIGAAGNSIDVGSEKYYGYFVTFFDIDGDALPDRVMRASVAPYGRLVVQPMLSTGGLYEGDPFDWLPIETAPLATGVPLSVAHSVEALHYSPWTVTFASLLDLNGDGLPDRIRRRDDPPGPNQYLANEVQLNNGRSFESSVSWPIEHVGPVTREKAGIQGSDVGSSTVRTLMAFTDINGDGLPDRVLRKPELPCTNFWVQLNTGNGFAPMRKWISIHPPNASVINGSLATGAYNAYLQFFTMQTFQDINGDGLPDRVYKGSSDTSWNVQLNNGAGFEPVETWGPLTCGGDIGDVWDGHPAYFVDVNADGLADWFNPHSTCVTYARIQLNTGSGMASGPGALVSIPNDHSAAQYQLIDVNGDGVIDKVIQRTDTPWPRFKVRYGLGPVPDLLTAVGNGLGATATVQYKSSATYDNRDRAWSGNPWSANAVSLLPFPVQTVESVTIADGLGQSTINRYQYSGGYYNAQEREFRGFSRVEVTDPLGARTIHWFHQGGGRDETSKGEYQDLNSAAKKGMPFRIERWGSDNKLYSLDLNKVEEAVLYPGVCFPYIAKAIQFDYAASNDDLGPSRAVAITREYHFATGSMLKESGHGEIIFSSALANHSWAEIEGKWQDSGNDDVYSHTTFYGVGATPFPSGWNQAIKNKAATHRVTSDSAGTQVLSEALLDYYGATGLLLKRRDRVCEGSYATNGFKYDVYGNVRYTTNEVGVVSETTYDAQFQTFPYQRITGTFTSTTVYDSRSGLVTDTTGSSGLKTKNIYDQFYRLKESRVSSLPNIEPDVWTEKYDYNLGGIVTGASQNYARLTKNNALTGDPGHETWTYTDGLGRIVQTRVESEPQAGFAAPFRVAHVVYDDRGQVRFQTLHYFGQGSAFSLLNEVKPCTFTQFDPIGRPFKITPCVDVTFINGSAISSNAPPGEPDSPLEPVTFAFSEGTDPWVTIRTDEQNKVRKFYLDAFGRTNHIIEVTGAANYTTLLVHDKLDRLTKITDHAGSVVEWAYDDLDRTIAMSDPHLGVWTWRRDWAGRVREQTDGRGNVVKSFYTSAAGAQDPLGRLLKKEVRDSAGALTESVIYAYDSGTTGFTVYSGQLASVTDGQGWTKFGYDVRGRKIKLARNLAVNNTTYTTEQTFDDADRVETILYPANIAKVRNTYDIGGSLSVVQQLDVATGAPLGSPAYTSKGYTALLQPNGATFGNGVETTLEFFPCSRRVERLRTSKGSTELQNLTYRYSAADNVKGISDHVSAHTGSASATISDATYDDLHRLKTLSRPGSATINYDYDAIGNTTLNGEAGGGAYGYGSARPQAVKSANGVAYTYDPCGNMTLRGGQQLDYDARNRLTQVSANGTPAATFGYADGGERLWKQTSAGLHVWIGTWYEVLNGVPRFHILANEKRVCTIEPSTATTHYQHGDHLGSASILTTATGAETRHWEYSPYGRERYASASSFAVSHRFTGQILDEETGLYFYGLRYYDPNLARFIQADTLISDLSNPQSFNRYAYTLNNPLKYVDPTGHEPGYWERVGHMYAGYYDFGKEFLGGALHMATHPIETTEAIGHAVLHPVDTGTAVWAGVKKTSRDAVGTDSRAAGKATAGIISTLVPAAKIKSVGTVGRLSGVTDNALSAAQKTEGAVAKVADNAAKSAPRAPITNPARLLAAPKAIARNPFHHIFPKRADLAAEFQKRGINPHDFAMQIPKALHQEIHSGGPRGGMWNKAWDDFFQAHPSAIDIDIYKEAGRLIHEFKLPGGPVVPYPR